MKTLVSWFKSVFGPKVTTTPYGLVSNGHGAVLAVNWKVS